MNKNIEIGNRIRQLRKEKKMTQAMLADRLRHNRTSIVRLESGEIELTALMRGLVCNLFGVREEWLLTGKEPKYTEHKGVIDKLEEKAKELGTDAHLIFAAMRAAYMLRRETNIAVSEGALRALSYDELAEPALFNMIKQIARIYNEGDKVKLEAIKAQLKAFDPGEKKQGMGDSEDAGTEYKSNIA